MREQDEARKARKKGIDNEEKNNLAGALGIDNKSDSTKQDTSINTTEVSEDFEEYQEESEDLFL